MASFSAQDVKSLRDATGAGMMDAKKALVEADGDRERAAQILRQKGLSKVATLEDRENNQGAIAIAREGNAAALVQLKAETDFSAKSEDFVELTQRMAEAVLRGGEGALEGLKDDLDTIKIQKKENIELGEVVRFEAADGAVLETYLHRQDGRGVNGVLLEVDGGPAELVREIAQHIAFAKPTALTRDEVDADLVERARASFEELTRKEGKPEQAVPKIVEGRLNAWYAERVLPEQGVFGEKETVEQRLGGATITRYAQAVITG